jgi:hypothetical protein
MLDSILVVFRAAWKDFVRNYFRPIHNAKVLFGLEQEKSIYELIEEEEAIMARKRAETVG